MVTLNIASEDGEDPKVSAPAADAKIYDFADENAINEYAENIDLITFLTTLKQILPVYCWARCSDQGMVLSEKEMMQDFDDSICKRIAENIH